MQSYDKNGPVFSDHEKLICSMVKILLVDFGLEQMEGYIFRTIH
jgi:hypothetical protein